MASPIIDLHSHFFPAAVLDLLGDRPQAPRIAGVGNERSIVSSVGILPLGAQWFDLDHRIGHLDANDVVHQLISWPTTLNLEPRMELDEARPFWRAVNDGFGGVVRAHPDRFSALAVLSTEDINWSIAELRRAHHELGLIGFVLPINSLASTPGVRHLAPLLAEAQRLRSHVYLHTGYGSAAVPGQPAPVERDDAPGLAWTLGAMHHFASTFATIALTDAFDDYPDLTLQIAMLGGAGAAALLLEQATILPARLGGPPRPERLRKLYLDTGAAGQGPAAIGLAVSLLGAERVVFGSDYAPTDDIAAVLANVRQAPVAAEAMRTILFHNARALLAGHGVAIPLPSASLEDRHVRV